MVGLLNFSFMMRILLLATVVALSSCASLRSDSGPWPEDLPARAYYESYHNADPGNQAVQSTDLYLLWVKRFYKGWSVFGLGWQPMTEELLDSIECRPTALPVAETMATIGRKVSAEWAKNVDFRRISTNHLLVWGNALKESVHRGEEMALTSRVLADVDALLVGELTSDDIHEDRYYALGFDDDF